MLEKALASAEKYGYMIQEPRKLHRLSVGETIPTSAENIVLTHSRIDDIAAVKSLLAPEVIAQKTNVVPSTVWDRFVRWGFNKVIGPAVDSLVRRPMAFHYFVAAYDENMRYLRWMLDDDLLNRQIPELFGDDIDTCE